jgi:hypothetical protein
LFFILPFVVCRRWRRVSGLKFLKLANFNMVVGENTNA